LSCYCDLAKFVCNIQIQFAWCIQHKSFVHDWPVAEHVIVLNSLSMRIKGKQFGVGGLGFSTWMRALANHYLVHGKQEGSFWGSSLLQWSFQKMQARPKHMTGREVSGFCTDLPEPRHNNRRKHKGNNPWISFQFVQALLDAILISSRNFSCSVQRHCLLSHFEAFLLQGWLGFPPDLETWGPNSPLLGVLDTTLI
jgi:hypothetical protein